MRTSPDTGGHRFGWMAYMACRDVDPDVFSEPVHAHEARLICVVRCPVRQHCLANVNRVESGAGRDGRSGVVAGLTGSERWRLDPRAYRCGQDAPHLTFEEQPACGTSAALVRHLSLGERVDPDCWSAEVRRDRLDRVKRDSQQRPAEAS